MLKKGTFYLLFGILAACGGSQSDLKESSSSTGSPEDIKPPKEVDYEAINNCLHSTLSYKMQLEPKDYDSIATYYFHEIRDYEDKEIRKKNQHLQRLKQWYKDSASIAPATRAKEIEKEIDVLQQEVNRYFREIIGYVFVHSFVAKQKDTISAIFVMDYKCSYKELIKVKVITDPNPDDYIETIRSIEQH